MLYEMLGTVLMNRRKIASYNTFRIFRNKCNKMLQEIFFSKDCFLNLFFRHTIQEWNFLPEEVVNASDTETFVGYLEG